jgi:hypothetical protein
MVNAGLKKPVRGITLSGIAVLLLVVAAQWYLSQDGAPPIGNGPSPGADVAPAGPGAASPTGRSGSISADTSRGRDDADAIVRAYEREQSSVMVEFPGRVTKILPDDNDGSRHQRFIVQLSNDHTILIAHNIDLCERVPLRERDSVFVHGEYEWNDRGGIVHWTHDDPQGRHEAGWIEHHGIRYGAITGRR